MSIPLTGTGGLFTRIGALAAGLNELNAARGAGLNARDVLIRAQYETAQQDVLDGLLDATQSWQSQDQWASQLKSYAQQTLLRMAQDDGWVVTTFADALAYLRHQMIGAGTVAAPTDSINKFAVTTTPAAVTGNVGDGIMRSSLISPIDGQALDYCLAETITSICNTHSYPGGSATAGQEGFAVIGQTAARDPLAYEWPSGSGISIADNAASDVSGVITDGAFENWNVNVPTSWTTITGPTTISKSPAPYTGLAALRITGDGATLTRLEQEVANLQPQTCYPINCWMQGSAGLAAGVLRISLQDVSNTIINDEAGTANSFSVTLSTLPAAWGPTGIKGGFFRTPRLLPSTVKLVIQLTTAATNAKTLDLDRLSMIGVDPVYPGGPYQKIFSGATPFAINDAFTNAITNAWTTAKFVSVLARLWDLPANNIRIPSLNVGTISDGLIA